MIPQHLVSIIIPLFDREELVAETLNSVLAQNYLNWECIIVDDGSTDNSLNIAHSYGKRDHRFRVFQRRREPKGAPTCRNIGLEKSKGDYVIFLDSDDLLGESCLKQRMEKFGAHDECGFLVFQGLIFKEEINDTNKYFNIETNESDLNRFLRTESLWSITGAIYKRAIFDHFDFTEGLPFWQDVFLGVQFIVNRIPYKKYLDLQPDYFVRTTTNSVSRNGSFSKTPELLSKRIQILLSFKEEADKAKFQLTKNEMETLYNFIYLLSSRFVSEYGDIKRFAYFWLLAKKALRYGNWYISLVFQYLIYWRKYSKYLIKVRTIYYRLFSKYLPDTHELDKIKLHAVSAIQDLKCTS